MKLISSTVIVLAAAVAAAPASAQRTNAQPAAQAAAPAQIKLSSKAGKAIMDLQTAVNANDTANIPAKLAAAQAVAQTKDDHYAIGQLQLKAALAANNNAAAAAAADAMAASGFMDATKTAGLYKSVGVNAFNAKQYDTAVTLFQKASAANPGDAETFKFLGLAQNSSGHKAEASASLVRALQIGSASGQRPDEETYKQAVSIAYGAKAPQAVELGRMWVAAYPSADSWHDALAIYRNSGNPDPNSALDIMRLARATKSLRSTGDYNLYEAEVINASNFGEAKAVLAEGLAAGTIKPSDPVIKDIQKALTGKPTPTAAELAAREAGAKVPNAYLRVGDAYYGAGNYQKAAELYRKAAAAGEGNVANLRLGEALAMAGDKAGATTALNAVTGPQAELAKFWLIYVQHG